MSEYSHRNKLKLVNKNKTPELIKIQSGVYGAPSIMSYNSARSTNDLISSQPSFLSGELSEKDNDDHLNDSFHVIGIVPSVKSLKSNMPLRSRSLNASKASLSSKRSNIQMEAHDVKLKRKIRHPWFGIGRLPFKLAVICYFCALAFLITGITLIILTSFGNIFLPMDKAEFLGPAIVVVAVLFFAIGIKMTYKAYEISEISRKRLKFRAVDSNTVFMTTKLPESHTRDTLLSGTQSEMAVTKKISQL